MSFGGGAFATSTPGGAFGSFGTKPASTSGLTPFSFSQPSSTPAFGAAATGTAAAPAPAFSGFGAPTSVSKPPTLSFGGVTTTAAAPSAFGGAPFGAPTSTFGAGSTALGGGGFFSQGQQKATAPFGTTGAAAPALGLGFSQQPLQLQQQQQQQQQQQPQQQVEQLYNSVVHCSIFGDERDSILARWNMMQVFY